MARTEVARAVRIRPMAVEDREGVLDLYATVFGATAAGAYAERWSWSFDEGFLADQGRSWVLVDGDKIVGFLAAFAFPYRIDGREAVAYSAGDYMVHPDYRFHGLKLMKEYFHECDNSVTCDDMEATIAISQWLGAKSAGQLVRYSAPLDARLMLTRARIPRFLSPGIRLATLGLRLTRKLRSLGARSRAPVKRLGDFDERFDTLASKTSSVAPVMIARTSAFLRWRFGPRSPHAKREIGVVEDRRGQFAGYVIFCSGDGETPTGYILDLQLCPSADERVAEALMHFAMDRLTSQGAWGVRYHQLRSRLSPLSESALRRLGLRPRGSHLMLVRFADERMNEIASQSSNWSYAYADSEASFSAA